MTPELALILSRRGLVLHGCESNCAVRTADGQAVGRVEAVGDAWSSWARQSDGRHTLVATGLPTRDSAVCAVADHADWEDLPQVAHPVEPARCYPMDTVDRGHLRDLARDARTAREAGEILHTVELRLDGAPEPKRSANRTTRGVDEAIRAVEDAGWQCCGVEPWPGSGALLSFVRTE